MNKLKVIITGATGMVGEGVLHECLEHPEIEKVLVITRQPCGYSHPKLTEIIHKDFFDISPLTDRLAGYNACYFCLGVTSVGKKEPEYTKLTYTLTMNFATTLANLNPDMTFCYISGAGTDSSEKGKTMWARVKGKTENDLMKLPFRKVYNFRPGGHRTFSAAKTYTYLLQNVQVCKMDSFGNENDCSGFRNIAKGFGSSYDKCFVDWLFQTCFRNERHEVVSSGE